jgi:hypothetical protein
LAVPPSSLSITVVCATPLALVAVVNDNVPFVLSEGVAENRAGLSVVTVNFSVCDASLVGPGVIDVAHAEIAEPESSLTVTSAPLLKLGGHSPTQR